MCKLLRDKLFQSSNLSWDPLSIKKIILMDITESRDSNPEASMGKQVIWKVHRLELNGTALSWNLDERSI